eukprot:357767-Chlamydomonas_euryale.AAC.1
MARDVVRCGLQECGRRCGSMDVSHKHGNVLIARHDWMTGTEGSSVGITVRLHDGRSLHDGQSVYDGRSVHDGQGCIASA